MKYELASLPEPIRIQVQDYIEFLLSKYDQEKQETVVQEETMTPTAFIKKWAGFLEGRGLSDLRDDW